MIRVYHVARQSYLPPLHPIVHHRPVHLWNGSANDERVESCGLTIYIQISEIPMARHYVIFRRLR